MEFYFIADIRTSEAELHKTVSLDRVEDACESIAVLKPGKEIATVMTSWGEFEISRQEIMGGVRFALTSCPNALAWTLTTGYDPAPDKVVIHMTINRKEKSDEFIEEVVEFGNEWKTGLESMLS